MIQHQHGKTWVVAEDEPDAGTNTTLTAPPASFNPNEIERKNNLLRRYLLSHNNIQHSLSGQDCVCELCAENRKELGRRHIP